MAEEDLKIAELPESGDMKQLRACLFCSQVKSWEQFEKFGCTNCEEFLHLKSQKQKVQDCTSASFDG
jgi:transcription elongation factor SPT4